MSALVCAAISVSALHTHTHISNTRQFNTHLLNNTLAVHRTIRVGAGVACDTACGAGVTVEQTVCAARRKGSNVAPSNNHGPRGFLGSLHVHKKEYQDQQQWMMQRGCLGWVVAFVAEDIPEDSCTHQFSTHDIRISHPDGFFCLLFNGFIVGWLQRTYDA